MKTSMLGSKQKTQSNENSSPSSQMKDKADNEKHIMQTIKSRRFKRKRYNCDECQNRRQCEDCHNEEIEKDLQLMQKLVNDFNSSMENKTDKAIENSGRKRIKKLKDKNEIEEPIGQDSISQKPQEVNHEKKECKEDKGKDNDEQSKIERMIDKIVNKNDLKAKQAKIKEENPIRRSERTRNKATGFNYFDSYDYTVMSDDESLSKLYKKLDKCMPSPSPCAK